MAGNGVATADAGVDPGMRAGLGYAEMGDGADRGAEILRRVLGVEAGLDGVAGKGELVLPERQRLPGRDAELPFHQILAGDHLRHRMLDLQAGVHFHEVELIVLHDELDRAGTHVAHGAGGGTGGVSHGLAALGAEAGSGGFLQYLLMAALDGAVTLEQRDHGALRVPEDLDFDVAGVGEVTLDQDLVVAEGGAGLALGQGERIVELGGVLDDAHALAAAARGRLDHDRVADAGGGGVQGGGRLIRAVIARDQRHAGLRHQRLGGGFGAHGADGGRGRADEGDPRGGAGFGEVRVFAQEAVARVDGVRAGAPGHVQDQVAAQVGIAGGGGTQAIRGVRHRDMQAVRIGVRIDRDGADTHAVGGAHDPAGDLAAIGDQDGAEHRHIRNRPNRLGSMGALRAADRPRPRTMRVSAGSMMPSSQSRAVA